MKKSLGSKIIYSGIRVILIILALLCLFPFIHILALSLSSRIAVASGKVIFWPVNFTLSSYLYVLNRYQFWDSLLVSLQRVALGIPINMILTILAAYPLSMMDDEFRRRPFYVVFFLISMIFSGGLIPFYLVVNTLHLMDKIWALVLPSAFPVWNTILLLNFFRNLPKDMKEAAHLDGAGHMTVLWRIYVPTSTPAIATLVLFCAVWHWNEWFAGLLFMDSPAHYPLQTYLQSILINVTSLTNLDVSQMKAFIQVSDRTFKSAQIFVGAIPILMVYPFLQKYFTKGIVLGSVKG